MDNLPADLLHLVRVSLLVSFVIHTPFYYFNTRTETKKEFFDIFLNTRYNRTETRLFTIQLKDNKRRSMNKPILRNKYYLYLTEFFAGMSVMAVKSYAIFSRILKNHIDTSAGLCYYLIVVVRHAEVSELADEQD